MEVEELSPQRCRRVQWFRDQCPAYGCDHPEKSVREWSGDRDQRCQVSAGRALHIEHCAIWGFTIHGIDIELAGGGLVFVEDTISQDNVGSGLSALSTGTPVEVSIDRLCFDNNSVGVAGLDLPIRVTNSEAFGNSQVGFWHRRMAAPRR